MWTKYGKYNKFYLSWFSKLYLMVKVKILILSHVLLKVCEEDIYDNGS